MKNENIIFNQELINTFAEQINSQYIDNAYSTMCNILNSTFENICKTRPIVTDYKYSLVNECFTSSENQSSTLDIFVSIKSPQLELSSINLNKNYLKRFWQKVKDTWAEMKEERKKKKRRKKKEQTEQQQKAIIIPNEKYNIFYFKLDFMKELTKYFTEQTYFITKDNSLHIISKDDIGMNVNLYFVFEYDNNVFKLFNTTTNKFTTISLGNRTSNITNKISETNNNYITALRIFNGVYANTMSESLNQILIESILYNCPNELFEGETYNMFLKLLNYINMNIIQDFKSITDLNIELAKNSLANNHIRNFIKFIRILSKNI